MELSDWAEEKASAILEVPLLTRWAHTRGVAASARDLVPILGSDADLIIAAAWLHDIGYAPALADTGFHPLDGARYLRDVEHADLVLCQLVAHHSGALAEARERGLADELSGDFEPASRPLSDALTYCDMTTGPDGQRLTVERRLAEIRARYGPGDPVTRAIARSAPQLTSAVTRVTRKLAAPQPTRVTMLPAQATALACVS